MEGHKAEVLKDLSRQLWDPEWNIEIRPVASPRSSIRHMWECVQFCVQFFECDEFFLLKRR